MALPQHPVAALARRHFVIAALCLAASALFFAAYGATLGVVMAVFGAFMLWAGLVTRRSGRAVLLNNIAYERLSRGHVDEAEALLGEVHPREARKGSVGRSVALQGAMIALYRGDVEKAAAAATRGLEAPYGMFGTDHQKIQNAGLLALRALASASAGRDAEARADAERVEGAELTTPEAMARAGLARALVVSRADGATGLARIFAEGGGARMIEYLSPRERVLARALRRMARAPRPTAYREAAKRDEVVEANELTSWVAKLAPGAAKYATDAHTATADVETRVEPTAAARAEVARSRAKAPRSGQSRIVKIFALWVVLVSTFGVAFALFSPDPHGGRPAPVSEYVQPWYLSWWAIGALTTLGIVSLVAWQQRKHQRIVRALAQMRLDVARGEEGRAKASLERLSKSFYDAVAGNAWLGLAQIAERRAAFAECLSACDAGLARLSRTAAVRAIQADVALPEIVATRSFALAALGRVEESDAERARLGVDYPSYPYAGRAHLRVALAAALHAGDLEAAAKVARTRSADLPLSLRDDLLVDVVLAAVDGASPEELDRIAGELRDDDRVRAWVDAVAPGLRDRVRGRARVAVPREPEVHAMEHAKEDEAPPPPLLARVLP